MAVFGPKFEHMASKIWSQNVSQNTGDVLNCSEVRKYWKKVAANMTNIYEVQMIT